MDGFNTRTTRLQARRAAQQSDTAGHRAAPPIDRENRGSDNTTANNGPITRSKAAHAASEAANSTNRKRASQCEQEPAGKKQATWHKFALAIQTATAQNKQHLPDVIAGAVAESLDSPLQDTALVALARVCVSYPSHYIDSIVAQQQQAPAKHRFLRHLMLLASERSDAVADLAHVALCNAVCKGSFNGVPAAEVILDALLQDQHAAAKHILQSALAHDVDAAASQAALSALSAIALTAHFYASVTADAEQVSAAQSLVRQLYEAVAVQQQGLVKLLEAAAVQHHTAEAVSVLTGFIKVVPQQVFNDICSIPKQRGMQLLTSALISNYNTAAEDNVIDFMADLYLAGVGQPFQQQEAVLQSLLPAVQQQIPTAAGLLKCCVQHYSSMLLLPHIRFVLQQLLASSNKGFQEHLARALLECLPQDVQVVHELVHNVLHLLIKAMTHCKGAAAHIIAMIVAFIANTHSEGAKAMAAHTAALVAAAQPMQTLLTAKVASRCLAMVGVSAALNNQRQPLLMHVQELTAIAGSVDEDFVEEDMSAMYIEVLLQQLPSPAVSAGTAVHALLRNRRGTAALLTEQSLDRLFHAVDLWGPGAEVAALAISFLAGVDECRSSVLFSAPKRLAVLDGLQKLLELSRQASQPAGLEMLRVVCNMTVTALKCEVVPAYTDALAQMAWQVPAFTETAFAALHKMVLNGVGVLEIAPHAPHVACAATLHAPNVAAYKIKSFLLASLQAVQRLKSTLFVSANAVHYAGVQLAQVYPQFVQSPGNRKLHACVWLWLHRLNCVSEAVRRLQQQVETVSAAAEFHQQEIEAQVRQASEQQQQQDDEAQQEPL